MEYIIGVSYGHHESSCTLISSNGQIIYLREEWLSRVKNDYRFPIFSLNYLKQNLQCIQVSLFQEEGVYKKYLVVYLFFPFHLLLLRNPS